MGVVKDLRHFCTNLTDGNKHLRLVIKLNRVIALSENKKNNAAIKLAASYILPLLCGTAVSAVLIALSAWLMCVLGLPHSTAGGASFVALAAGTLASGALCGLIRRRGGLKCGAICGILFLLPMLVISAVSGNISGSAFAGKILTIMLVSCIGGVLGVNAGHR